MCVYLSVSVLPRKCLVIVVCVVLSVWMSRLGNGGVSKYYAPMTAWNAQSPDHIPTCYLTVYLTVCLSILISVPAFICLAYTSFFHVVGAPTRPESSQRHFIHAGISPADLCSATRSPLVVLYITISVTNISPLYMHGLQAWLQLVFQP